MRLLAAPARLAANGLWWLLCAPEALRFHRACADAAGVAAAQEHLLLRLLARNAETEYGRRYGFAGIRSLPEYQERVPLTTYDDYQDAVERIGAGERAVLTADPVRLLEPTSGSTAATKLIPYTAALKAEFQRGIAPWIVDLYRREPRLLAGRAYWSVTPVARRGERTPGGIPVGFEEDAEYFGALQRALIQSVMAVPGLVRLIDDVDTFRYVTLLFLLRSRDLALISVWSPTFLLLLVERLPAWWPQLAADLAAGALSPPGALEPNLGRKLQALLRPDVRRAAEVHQAYGDALEPAAAHARLWPRLRVISCWADGQAARYAPDVARRFPQARIQAKGLMATEGLVSFPLGNLAGAATTGVAGPIGPAGAALAIRSHFLEFLPEDAADPTAAGGLPVGATGRPRLAHELEPGGRYSLALTTGGGLYRYRLHDLVEVAGRYGACPLVRFAGKEALVSDWFGEKLNERFVAQAFDGALSGQGLHATFAMVACDDREAPPAYTLYVEAPDASDPALRRVAADLEASLRQNYHYRYCRDLGQLAPLRVFLVDEGAHSAYLAACREFGQRLGDVKPVALHPRGGWWRAFRGRSIAPQAP